MKITVFDRITASKPKIFIGADEYDEIVRCKNTGIRSESWVPVTAHKFTEGVLGLVPGLLGEYDGVLVVRKP